VGVEGLPDVQNGAARQQRARGWERVGQEAGGDGQHAHGTGGQTQQGRRRRGGGAQRRGAAEVGLHGLGGERGGGELGSDQLEGGDQFLGVTLARDDRNGGRPLGGQRNEGDGAGGRAHAAYGAPPRGGGKPAAHTLERRGKDIRSFCRNHLRRPATGPGRILPPPVGWRSHVRLGDRPRAGNPDVSA
jgi:hypothetical protein